MGFIVKLVVVLGAAALAATPLPRGAVEDIYARGVYPLFQPRLTAFANRVPFALFDAVVVGSAVLILTMWAVRLARARGRRLRAVLALSLDTAALAALLYVWFLAAWGLNYQREPLRTRLDYSAERITDTALRAFAVRMVEALNALHGEAHAAGWDEPGPAASPALEAAFARARRDLAIEWPVEPGVPKPSLFDFYFKGVSVDGMTDPFFLETLANQSLLPFERPATIAHEWAHLAGFAEESEASFIAWLASQRGPAPIQYSGWLAVYGTVMNALPPHERDEIAGRLEGGPRDDLRAIADRVERDAIPLVRRAGRALYDRYLRANRVESGIRSYSEVLRLLLGTAFDEKENPVLKRAEG